MDHCEIPTTFLCEQDTLTGIVHTVKEPVTTGVIILVAGGPQFRVGANRQFITLARRLQAKGFPSIRFDHRGMGDSGGEFRGFLDMGDDIRCAIDELIKQQPGLKNVVLWGECESASAAAFYAHTDPRVSGIFMANPWIRTETGQAKTYLKHYYWNRLRDPEFWKKIRSGAFDIRQSLASLSNLFSQAFSKSESSAGSTQQPHLASLPLPLYLTESLSLYTGSVCILLSGFDYIAQEFRDFIANSKEWKNAGLDQRVKQLMMEDADHTFSRKEWRESMFCYSEQWVENCHLNSE